MRRWKFRDKKFVLKYLNTNEYLPAIIKGMALENTDNVLSICGSADQALAILEYVNKVIVVDNNPTQIEFSQIRRDLLYGGDYKGFLAYPDDYWPTKGVRKRRNDYFLEENRLDMIKSKLGMLEFKHVNIFLFEPNGIEINKVYLSNAHSMGSNNKGIIPSSFGNFLPKGGIIYSSKEGISYSSFMFSKHSELTKIAQNLEEKNKEYAFNPRILIKK